MARKRMIAPSMWESESFSDLSDFSKLVFISLISHADDEGRGKAKAATVTNVTFPNDENRRVADVKKALSEIALKMSVQFYSVDGREYYAMTNWLDYQKIDKPTKSKLPPPPTVGERGSYTQNGKFDDNSGSTRGEVGESSKPNIIEENIREDNNTPNSACAREEEPTEFEIRFKAFCEKWGIVIDSNSPLIADFNFDKFVVFIDCTPTPLLFTHFVTVFACYLTTCAYYTEFKRFKSVFGQFYFAYDTAVTVCYDFCNAE